MCVPPLSQVPDDLLHTTGLVGFTTAMNGPILTIKGHAFTIRTGDTIEMLKFKTHFFFHLRDDNGSRWVDTHSQLYISQINLSTATSL